MLKAMTRNGAFWRSLKRCFGSLNCLEKIESTGRKWCIIMTLFETMFLELVMLRKSWKQSGMWCILTLFKRTFWKLYLPRLFLNNRRLIETVFCSKRFFYFKSWHPNLVCTKSCIRRTKPRNPEYRLKWHGIWRIKKGVSPSNMLDKVR